ncbi:hypothetical protein I4U23_027087 [Adineta vaga]|nr:hypothetical protein I4U23_027087 [Adineta vaga]
MDPQELDEKNCWILENHQCNENEFQCSFYGQCIPLEFLYDKLLVPDCLDQTDNLTYTIDRSFRVKKYIREPTFLFEDISCVRQNLLIWGHIETITSSCVLARKNLLLNTIFSMKSNLTMDHCLKALKCSFQRLEFTTNECLLLCDKNNGDYGCYDSVKTTCPNLIFIPLLPRFRSHIYIVYEKSKIKFSFSIPSPTYFCYDDQSINIPNDGKELFKIQNKTCRYFKDSININEKLGSEYNWLKGYYMRIEKWLYKINDNAISCDQSTMYQCRSSSKCISKTRLLDIVADCYYEDDEDLSLLKNIQTTNQIQCQLDGSYIPWYLYNDDTDCHCNGTGDNYCFDENLNEFYFRKKILFQTICDKFPHLAEEFTLDKNETDETNCEQWPNLHIYNRCDGYWNFLNGEDELNCDSSLEILPCSSNQHICVSIKTYELICLSIENVNDGIIDCIGAADEPTICSRFTSNEKNNYPEVFACPSKDSCIMGDHICDQNSNCDDEQDEKVCKYDDLIGIDPHDHQGICTKQYELHGSNITKILCRLFVNSGKRSKIYFTLDQNNNFKGHRTDDKATLISIDYTPSALNAQSYQQRCHRGLDLKIWLDKQNNLTKNVCLCPPSYYGNQCQYQNQRISLTLHFRVTAASTLIPFIIIISLIDHSEERLIHSYEQIHFLSTKYCEKRFNIYLLYSSKPKDLTNNYSIQIDFYEKLTLNHRGSILKHINYSFLPVHRLAFQLNIPDQSLICSNKQCVHGKCFKYFNNLNNETFCQCDRGWTGKYCTIKYNCLCSSKSLYLGKLVNNRSLCVCPINRIGPRCLIYQDSCNICQNGGQCIVMDEYEISLKKYICICPKGYSGDQCEQIQTKFEILFNKNENLYPSIFIHFIEIKKNDFPIRTTTIQRTRIGQNFLSFYWSLPYHIVFIELLDKEGNKNYYLISIQKKYQSSLIIKKSINSFDQCLNINELLNETIMNYHFLRRIKYYHLPCQRSSTLLCFYDEQQFCLCQQLDHYEQRVTNCLNFNYTSDVNCRGKSICEHNGKCFEENSRCPKYFLCQCSNCYYGIRCEFTMDGFTLSLDSILAYHTYPNKNFFDQSYAILIRK